MRPRNADSVEYNYRTEIRWAMMRESLKQRPVTRRAAPDGNRGGVGLGGDRGRSVGRRGRA